MSHPTSILSLHSVDRNRQTSLSFNGLTGGCSRTLQAAMFAETMVMKNETTKQVSWSWCANDFSVKLWVIHLPTRAHSVQAVWKSQSNRTADANQGAWITTHKRPVTWSCWLLTSMVTSACLRPESRPDQWDLPFDSKPQGKVRVHPLTSEPTVGTHNSERSVFHTHRAKE
jgi:hypothetical protein